MLGLILALTFSAATAAETNRVTLEEALRRASTNNPALSALQYGERAADGLIEQAGLRPNPTVDITAENLFGTGRLQGVKGLETTVQATQVLERGDKRRKRVTLASREKDLTTAEISVRRLEITESSASAFVALLAAQQQVALAKEPLKLTLATLQAVEVRVNTGAASQAEAARAKAAVATAQNDLAKAEANVQAARATLASTWGELPANEVAVGDPRIPDAALLQGDLSASLQKHPAIAAQQAVVDAQRATLELEKANAKQDLSVGGGMRFLRDGTDVAFVAGVSIPLALKNRNQGNIRAARERLAGAELQVRATEIQLRARLGSAMQDLSTAHATTKALRFTVLPATQEAYDSVRKAYDVGQLPLINVLDAQQDLVAIRRQILEAETAFLNAMVRVNSLIDPSYSRLSAILITQ